MSTYQMLVLRSGYLTGLAYQKPLRSLEHALETARQYVSALAAFGAIPVIEERRPGEEPVLHPVK